MTAAIAMMASHPECQRRVAEEMESIVSPVSFDSGSRLAYTQASIKEAQRLYPVIGMSLPRTVPSGGFRAHGHYFPPGTTVGCNPVSLHRNVELFGSDVEEFNPDRWSDPALDARAMERCNLTWGGGARTCPGRHLAELIVYKVVPTLMKEFHVEVDIPDEEGMPFYFMSMLSGVKARFLPRQEGLSGRAV
jgi:cytochrome P450